MDLGSSVFPSLKGIIPAEEELYRARIRFQMTPMATVLEADTPEEAVEVVLRAHEAPRARPY